VAPAGGHRPWGVKSDGTVTVVGTASAVAQPNFVDPDGRVALDARVRCIAAVAAVLVFACGAHAGTLALAQHAYAFLTTDTAISPDGRFLYAVQSDLYGPPGLVVAARDAATGRLTPVATVDAPFAGCCTYSSAIALSPDGTSLYVGNSRDDSVFQFARDAATGLPAFVARVGRTDPGVQGLDGVTDVQVSPDGKSVYVTSKNDETLAVFARNTSTGALAFVEAQANGVGPLVGAA
jgi:6-phosphogluconolactonase (cycloisomerase 2 family)